MIHNQPLHLVNQSPWPLCASLASLGLMSSFTTWFHLNNHISIFFAVMCVLISIYYWWHDTTTEPLYNGDHSNNTQAALGWGILLFITSEVMFFSAFFWAFFHSSLAPSIELGASWPPQGVNTLDPFSVPLLNTAILLSSGLTVTASHYSILVNKNEEAITNLYITVMLGILFTYLQWAEYQDAEFSISDSVYGAVFFVATGFHGAHVIIGTTILSVIVIRVSSSQFSSSHHFGLEAAAWYWHFVDVVWIFLFIVIYWWATP